MYDVFVVQNVRIYHPRRPTPPATAKQRLQSSLQPLAYIPHPTKSFYALSSAVFVAARIPWRGKYLHMELTPVAKTRCKARLGLSNVYRAEHEIHCSQHHTKLTSTWPMMSESLSIPGHFPISIADCQVLSLNFVLEQSLI